MVVVCFSSDKKEGREGKGERRREREGERGRGGEGERGRGGEGEREAYEVNRRYLSIDTLVTFQFNSSLS